MAIRTKATLADLYKVPGKAELVDGSIVHLMPTGADPGYAADEIFVSLRNHAKHLGYGRAVSDNKGFRVDLPHRESFSPDAAFYVGTNPGMKFYPGAPLFAIEVRSENDYGPEAETEMAAKRADYFASGTQVVWDVDLLGESVIRAYFAQDPVQPRVFTRGQTADAEPVLPGWRFKVDDLFSTDLE